MEFLENIVEYYDELYPVSAEQTDFFESLLNAYPQPVKLLRIGCGTGAFEHTLARKGIDVTGTDSSREFIDIAVRRRRMPNTAVRFFQMNPSEIGRFLAKDFYNCIAVLEGFLYFMHDKTLLRKFFYDCRSVLAQGGILVLHVPDISVPKESLRVKLTSVLEGDSDSDTRLLSQTLVHGDAKPISVRTQVPVYIPKPDDLSVYAQEASFTSFEFYSDWQGGPCSDNRAVIWVLR